MTIQAGSEVGFILKILVVRVGRVGDMCMITAALKAILNHFPSAEIHLLTSVDGKRVLKDFSPRLTQFIIHDRSKLLAKYDLARIAGRVRATGYEKVFCFETNPSFAPLYRWAGKDGYVIEYEGPHVNYARRCLNVVARAVGHPVGDDWAWLPVSEEGRAKAKALLAQVGVEDSAFVVALHPTFSGSAGFFWERRKIEGRSWPVTSFARLAVLLDAYARERGVNLKLIMDVLPEEEKVGREVVRLSGGRVSLLTPPLDFQRYKATLERADLLVSADSGPMHLAGAVGTNLVALFGKTDPNDSGAYVAPERRQFIKASGSLISGIEPEQVFEQCKFFFPQV